MARLFLIVLVGTYITRLQANEPVSRDEGFPQSVLVVVGAEGTADYGKEFQTWTERWQQAAISSGAEFRFIGGAQSVPLDGTTASRPAVAEEDSDLAALEVAIRQSGQQQTSEPLWLVLIGHGTFDSRTARFNLRGPDLEAQQLAEWCRDLKRPLALINCSSCSAPFLNVLSGSNRVIITATKDGNQIQYSRFGDAMSKAINGLEADINRDGQTSLLEAWLYASRRTADFYVAEGRLATEHSLLDDNGDAQGSRVELFAGDRPRDDIKDTSLVDGRQAGRWHLVRSAEEQQLTVSEREQRVQLEQQLESLRARRSEFDEAAYLKQLEAAALPLAQLYQAVEMRQKQSQP
ncbi:MAG: hypothetical protein KDA85_05925 [Planctomycetaceae bacterium]|nr:hypothetical protein [Planctomycetaceae bacterium]